MSDSNEKTFSYEVREGGVALVTMDVPGEPVNTLQMSFADEFEELFADMERDERVVAVVFSSGKKDSFLAGADITMLQDVKTAGEATELSRRGQLALDKLSKFKVPVVAAIHGACLGGGLEVALACTARIASDWKKTKLGLPEVQLGVLPGAGGTQRSPRLVGIAAALDLLCSGKQLDGKRAKKIGLVDEVVPEPILIEVAIKHAKRLAAEGEKGLGARIRELLTPEHLKEVAMELSLERNPLGRHFVFNKALEGVTGQTHGNYPAPERILEVVRVGLAEGIEAGLRAEAEAFGELVVSPVAEQLMGIHFAMTALKKDNGTDDPYAEIRTVRKIGMLGAGLMGSGIAYVTSAIGKIPVRLKDRDHEGVGRGLAAARKLLDERVKRRRMTKLQRDEVFGRISGATDYRGFHGCDVVIEAVFEDLELKRTMVRQVEEAGHDEVIFASNTSSIPITDIAEASSHPETVIGMHYFSPVHKMPLLEIIVTEKTAPWVTATCVGLGKKQGKTVIVVNDGVGFYTTRVLSPYMNEAAYVLAEGHAIDHLDEALVKFGWPVGPITLMDEVGIDVGEKVGKIVYEAFGERLAPPAGVEALIADGRLGRKNGRGFYRYDDEAKKIAKAGGKKPVDPTVYALLGVHPHSDGDPEQLALRCTMSFVNEAARCFGEGILRSARDGDIGAMFGLGFPPFLGGPFRYVDRLGAAAVVDELERLKGQHGVRFEPAPILVEMAREGGHFYGEGAVVPGRHKEAVAAG
ncbi:MAG: fatty acid oxidation complex subunit alpha FadJ [Planctomycetes bacterium]|nr:fatty acid oxidation complex subunit alpha FadJ [Planctomycetota bacterium]